ncbi:MlaC/ttg2D family ABC transporter substrate-binding protein [Maricaulaceae bacterium MS644]
MFDFVKTAALTAFAVLGLWSAPVLAQSAAAQDAESFVSENAQEVISSLQELESGEVQLDTVREDFRERIQRLADLERITNFVLGRYRRTASEEQLTEFRDTFREYAFSVYENELNNYAGQTLEVTRTITRRDGDYIVESDVTGGPDGRTYEVNWRVLRNESGDLQVVDVQVMGIWLAQTQRDQIISVIGNNRGDVSAATELLRSKLDSGDLPSAEDLSDSE